MLLQTPPGGWLEKWEMERKIRKFSHQVVNDEIAFSPNWCKGHFDGHRRKVLEEFDQQWQQVSK